MPSPLPSAMVRRFTQPGVILVAIILTGAMGLVGGFRQLRSQVLSPFTITPTANQGAALGASAQSQDTDQDGLTDTQELQVYGTSPYVADTDSDSVPDGKEVADGTDPNCPAGTTCAAWTASGSAVAPAETPAPEQPAAPTTQTLTPEQLRAALIQSGVPAEQVNSLTDEQLQAAWQAALQQAGASQ
jgi:hypothetical protein